MVRSLERQILAVTVVGVVAALVASSALAAGTHRGPGPGGPAVFGFNGGFGAFGPGPGGPAFGVRGFGPGPGGHHRGHRGLGGPGPLAGPIIANTATYLGLTRAQVAAALKSGKTLAQLATDNGKTAAGLVDALVNEAKGHLADAVAAGWLTQAKADAIAAQLAKHLTRFVNNGPPKHKAKPPFSGPLEKAATYLGTTAAELKTALGSGKSLAQIATEKGKTVDGLVAALTEGAKEKLDAAVAAKTITQAQADAYLAKLTASVKAQIERVPRTKPAAATTKTAAKFAFIIKR
jgi:hypothetical protein